IRLPVLEPQPTNRKRATESSLGQVNPQNELRESPLVNCPLLVVFLNSGGLFVVASFIHDSMGLLRSSMAQDLDFNITHSLVVHEECVDLFEDLWIQFLKGPDLGVKQRLGRDRHQ